MRLALTANTASVPAAYFGLGGGPGGSGGPATGPGSAAAAAWRLNGSGWPAGSGKAPEMQRGG